MKTYRRPNQARSVAQRLRLARRRAQQLHILQDVSQQIAAALEVETVLSRLVQTVYDKLGYHFVAAALTEGDQLVFRKVAAQPGYPLPPYPEGLPLDGPGLATWAVRQATPVIVDDVATDPRYLTRVSLTRAELVVPMFGRFGVIGVIDLQSEQPAAFDRHDLRLIQTLSEHAASAIENARLYQSAQERRRELEALQSISLEIGGELDLDTLLQMIAHATASAFAADATALLIAELKEEHVAVRAHEGLPDDLIASLRISKALIESHLDEFGNGGVLELPHPDGERVIRPTPAERAGFASVVLCRLTIDGVFTGVLSVYSRAPRRFSASERRLLSALGQQAALAIGNARRYEHERLLAADLEQSYNELRQMLAELERKEEQLERTARMRALGELSSGVAHDFNNLLAGILGHAQLLLMDERNPDRRHMLRVIEQAAQDGAATVRRIQEFARRGERSERDLVTLAEVIDGALAITRARWNDEAQRDGQRIHVRQQIDPALIMLGNPAELRELLINLIINAVDAMPHGGDLTIRLAAYADEGPARAQQSFQQPQALIEVSDTGVGIPPELHERIFDSFFSTKPSGKGSGLGLAICQNIVSRHGGRIEVRSAPGQGATFRVILPLGEAAPAPPPRAEHTATTAAYRILVVDDEPAVREALTRMLQRGGHQVTPAVSGEDALARFAPGRFDLLFTDLGMPGMGGAALLKELRARDPNLIAVVITGWGQDDDTTSGLLGAARVLAKPFSAAQISGLVGELMQPRAV